MCLNALNALLPPKNTVALSGRVAQVPASGREKSCWTSAICFPHEASHPCEGAMNSQKLHPWNPKEACKALELMFPMLHSQSPWKGSRFLSGKHKDRNTNISIIQRIGAVLSATPALSALHLVPHLWARTGSQKVKSFVEGATSTGKANR